jgi:hypothetical protein
VLDVYADNYRTQFGHLHGHQVRPVTVNNARGCENGYKRCTYCSIADLTVNTGDPRGFWKAIDQYNREHGINLFFEVYDSFTASPRYVDALIAATPPYLKRRIDDGELQVMVYARALGLTGATTSTSSGGSASRVPTSGWTPPTPKCSRHSGRTRRPAKPILKPSAC